jgi:chromodomain-helicase-DNA-binding protein 7
MTKEEVEKLLRHGAYDMFQEDNDGTAEKESNAFMEQDIDTILERRAKTVVHENTGSKSSAAGGKFSKASFKALGGSEAKDASVPSSADVDIDDPDFWKKIVGEAKFENNAILQSDMKRSRSKAVTYTEAHFEDGPDEGMTYSDASSSSDTDESDTDSEQEKKSSAQFDDFDFTQDIQNENLRKLMKRRSEEVQKFERKRWGGKFGYQWVKEDAEVLVKHLLRYGYGNIDWGSFYSVFKESASKEYDDIEVRIPSNVHNSNTLLIILRTKHMFCR